MDRAVQQRFRSMYTLIENGCWIWKGHIRQSGFGTMANTKGCKPIKLYAHRVAYEIFIGSIPSGHAIEHTCGNKACVNPTHLVCLSHKGEDGSTYYRDIGRRGGETTNERYGATHFQEIGRAGGQAGRKHTPDT